MKTSKWALFVSAAIILFGMLAAVPNVLTSEQQAKYGRFLPANPVTLGLDLKGGSHLVLEVDSAALRKASFARCGTAAKRMPSIAKTRPSAATKSSIRVARHDQGRAGAGTAGVAGAVAWPS